MKCEICGKEYELQNKHGGHPKVRKVCGSNSCSAKWQYRLKTDWFLERARNQYWNEKQNNYERLHKRNVKAKTRQRFGVDDRLDFIKQLGGKCQNCGSEKGLVIHHIDNQGRKVQNLGQKPNNELSNLRVICHSCHTLHHVYGKELKLKT